MLGKIRTFYFNHRYLRFLGTRGSHGPGISPCGAITADNRQSPTSAAIARNINIYRGKIAGFSPGNILRSANLPDIGTHRSADTYSSGNRKSTAAHCKYIRILRTCYFNFGLRGCGRNYRPRIIFGTCRH